MSPKYIASVENTEMWTHLKSVTEL